MHVHFIIHESYEGPGAFTQWITDRGFKQTSSRLYLGDALPSQLDFDLLIILGGPQSPLTRVQECAHFSAQNEINLISQCIEAGKAILGVCLGAQLIGEALGAKFESSPNTEIGYFPITLTDVGQSHSMLSHFKHQEVVGHWHNDMPGVLPSTKILASSAACPRQIVEYSELIYGFQCHLEFTKESMRELVNAGLDASLVTNEPWVQSREVLLATDTINMNTLLFSFLDDLVDNYRLTL
ncbi:GMP synthase family protein [Shewanella psychrophila]|uniref:GMP synthase family protein n=1 Tax=Shewanella psychrophila TaxID=225848 RepID=A0A1S6HXT2_9GAMM|nr:GMP synthase [Shewanella psychrophila]AQS40321.1 GMP synthase family protein [Shewanella psychrophila]